MDYSIFTPSISVDCVIIGYKNNKLHVLTMKWKNVELWSLPGGFIQKNEDMNQAALRILKNRTGLEISFLEQFYTFSSTNRKEDERLFAYLEKENLNDHETRQWLNQRFISTGYLALVDIDKSELIPDVFSEKCEWIPTDTLPNLIFDHNHIVSKALDHLKIKIRYLPIGKALLPEKFTMKDLQYLYEFILDTKLDRANFQKKILRLDFLTRLEKQLTGGAHKAPYLYTINSEKYKLLIEKGIGFI